MGKDIVSGLATVAKSRIVFLIMDGLGGIPNEAGKTELEAAQTPNLDALALRSICGLLDPIGAGITPGSGPAHFALFGYDPQENNVGRGLLEGAGIGFPMREGDLLVRVNFASLFPDGTISDRRAGRIETSASASICEMLQRSIKIPHTAVEVFFAPVREHRALMVLRGGNLSEELAETDPQKTGLAPLPPSPLTTDAESCALVMEEIIAQARKLLSHEQKVHIPLLRGYAKYRRYPSMQERYKMRSLAIAYYPMYRGIAQLIGMDVATNVANMDEGMKALVANFNDYDFFFFHIKETDSRGEDGNFAAKVETIERVDRLLPQILDLQPDVLVVTGDHSTPAVLGGHSWHPVPALLYAKNCRPDMVASFGERACLGGSMGQIPMKKLMALALANAGRLLKFGA
ncbi:MAG: 2,3-bisphosphoglycerate-independent phosphoglycerate mutase [Deltaproteobacteria bacterium]|nr:2,3-bisphosphoglycerate-independent phosphoglycerate mutase [Deltaproteobacteria bacterium]